MPDRRRHRGPHPEDAVLFGDPAHLRKLALAAGDLAWLLGRRYAPKAALTLVGNRYQLNQRQRRVLAHAVASPEVARQCGQHRITPPALAGQRLQVDALNQIITVEVALAGGLLLRVTIGSGATWPVCTGRTVRCKKPTWPLKRWVTISPLLG